MKSFQFFFYVVLFVSLLFFNSCKKETPTEPEEPPKPIEVSLNTNYSGEISQLGEVDHYTFFATNDYYIHFSLKEAQQNSLFSPYIRILDYATKELLIDKWSETEAWIINYKVELGKKYEILVSDDLDNRTGAYNLYLKHDTDDEKPLIVNQEITGEIYCKNDYDDFILNITETGYYHISVKEYTPNSAFNPQVSLLNFDTKALLDDETSYTEAVLVNKNLGHNSNYWVRVQEWSDDEVGKYIITYMKDPDDSVSFYSNSVYYEGSINYVNDRDKLYFRPTANANFKIYLAEKIPGSEFNPHLKVYGFSNNLISEKTSYDSCVVYLDLDSNQLYGVEAREWSDDRAGEYILKIEMQ